MKQSRRNFIRTTALAGLAVGFNAKSYSRIMGANDRVNFAVIGLHGRGHSHLASVSACDNTAVTHICDVDKKELTKFLKEAKEKYNQNPLEIIDFREILDSKDVDAITIATPEHWHAPMTIMGLQAGKHVYVEKPCCHNPYEGELIIEAKKKYSRLVQMGNQQRSSHHTIKIMQRIKEGLVGTPYYGEAWYSNTRKSIGIGKEAPVPEYLNWNLWQGPAPRRSYKDNIHPYNWHWFWHWGTGETLNNGTHEVDLCRWALAVDYPNSVKASGGRYHFKDDWEFYDTLVTSFEYNDKLITWEGKSCNGKRKYNRGRGAAIHGTEGSVIIDRDGYEVYDLDNKMIEEFKKSEEKTSTQDLLSMDNMTDAHFQNLINGIKNNEKLRSPIEEGNISVTMLLLSNIAWKLNRVLNLSKSNGHILSDDEAMKYWRREYEPGWELKV